ncbi:Putative phytanoyl-CoA dioxygenase [Septoria linicola]|uniref:Phytanoyl-CoA dioxygenase n=1 Tax=Septoria linicola TaxID=215465 RepID=A0A9Q9EHS8_9PEZI|nr:putative phytanoyl-CoA dioxygenase [Septoria linicola]USW51285.1 Putative phytanoyl-CoA dioxygenase [Septoria linicola]
MASTSAEELRASLERDGFVRIPQVLSADELNRYRAACQRTVDKARLGQWPFVRTLPKQFPPWNASDATQNGIWGVQHLLHPDMPDRDVFAESYFNDKLIDVVLKLLGCSKDDLVLELYNMLCRPTTDFALRWHRDNVPASASAEEELRHLQEPMIHAQWNLALYDDSSLVVVPGSHRRARTDMERGADPFEDDMPGQLAVKMAPGDIVFYNNNILHRGVYDSTTERMTLHGSMGITKSDPERARNILQHGIGTWASDADFTNLVPEMSKLAEGMKARLISMGTGDSVGFTHQD